ncbi:GDSL-type esterase/lipase family protein [Nonomuraea zeae]|uniref:GDSL-type esterase/lipase family protein n=1 Tax=Nonomuraea zeae TaxID=1642303 RepID=UPI001478E558|nr:GDSL-type esterase/lipase family protein [Nonomuraea zeae]
MTSGDAVSHPDLPGGEPLQSRFFLSGIDLWAPADRQVVAAVSDSLADVLGERGLARFNRDLLTVPDVTHVVVRLGVNDIGMPGMFDLPQPPTSDLIAGLSALAEQARQRALKAAIATITPFSGAALPGFDTPESEQARQRLNRRIRANQAYDAVAELDRALRDPPAPAALRPDYDSGDHVHPNDAGAQAMADTIAKALLV